MNEEVMKEFEQKRKKDINGITSYFHCNSRLRKLHDERRWTADFVDTILKGHEDLHLKVLSQWGAEIIKELEKMKAKEAPGFWWAYNQAIDDAIKKIKLK